MSEKHTKTLLIIVSIVAVLSLMMSVFSIVMLMTNSKSNGAERIDALEKTVEELSKSKLDVDFNTNPFIGFGFDPTDNDPTGIDIIHPYSPAALAGLQEGDVIKTINSVEITTYEDIVNCLSETEAYEMISISVERTSTSGKKVTLTLELTTVYAGYFYPS